MCVWHLIQCLWSCISIVDFYSIIAVYDDMDGCGELSQKNELEVCSHSSTLLKATLYCTIVYDIVYVYNVILCYLYNIILYYTIV